jgi:1-hydroxycarotenoid 3,4-desaturase
MTRRRAPRVIVVGAGIGGLSAALDLARQGCDVQVLERAASVGGKLRQVAAGDGLVDAGPTVFTMRWVFESLLADAGARLDEVLPLQSLPVLARHAWRDGGTLDLFADLQLSCEAIAAFAGAAEAEGYRRFCQRSGEIYRTLRGPFIAAQRPSPPALLWRAGLQNLAAMWRTAPLQTLWGSLHEYFADPRLRQLFGRYATYVGSSPLLAPATLMLIAHVEQEGVWAVQGGMKRIALALQQLGEHHGAQYRCNSEVARIVVQRQRVQGVQLADGQHLPCDAVVFNGDSAALSSGLLGPEAVSATAPTTAAQRSLSAVTWCVQARASGFALHHHNVFFAADYPAEFKALFGAQRICDEPTVYLCAQDRGAAPPPDGTAERMLLLINAPANGDSQDWPTSQVDDLAGRSLALLRDCGLHLSIEHSSATTPAQFNQLFPATGGALYGRANHGSMASFARPGSRSRVGGLYLAGGSVHPGAGLPMATLSGRLAAHSVVSDLGLTSTRNTA